MNELQMLQELEAEVRRQKELVEKAGRDCLTGLLTRNGAVEQINKILAEQSHGSFCMLDMDNFKAVNDIYGHIEGDRLLVRFANILKRVAGEHAVLARLGGDEFIIFLKKRMSQKAVKMYAEHVIDAVDKGIVSPGKLVKVTVSMGISMVPQDGCTFEELYGNADKALYYVKNAGKNAVRFYQEPKKKKCNQNITYNSLKSIKLKMKEKEDMAGSYMVDFTSFENIYRFMERNIARDKREIQCVLFTVAGLDAEVTRRDIIKEEMSYLENAITATLRKGDVTTIYSATQMLVLLMDVDRRNAASVVSRIVSEYHRESQNDELRIVYEMEALGTDQLEFSAMNA